jgi:hypothetical protein
MGYWKMWPSVRLHMWFQHDGAPFNYNREMRQWLAENHPGRSNGRGCEAQFLGLHAYLT